MNKELESQLQKFAAQNPGIIKKIEAGIDEVKDKKSKRIVIRDIVEDVNFIINKKTRPAPGIFATTPFFEGRFPFEFEKASKREGATVIGEIWSSSYEGQDELAHYGIFVVPDFRRKNIASVLRHVKEQIDGVLASEYAMRPSLCLFLIKRRYAPHRIIEIKNDQVSKNEIDSESMESLKHKIRNFKKTGYDPREKPIWEFRFNPSAAQAFSKDL